ncbi:hypothetical protein CN285_29480 [Bacillus cereus]|nr:hypothetical protein CN285_29480 [Bacillus cereus]PGM59376.1 hypothetical protein CN947_20810 [Bacillus cereus]
MLSQIKEQLAKANCSAGSPRGNGERLGTSLNEFWLSPTYIIDGILSFIQLNRMNICINFKLN